MPATLLQICQDFFGERALAVPQAVYASTDPQVLQLKRILETSLENLVTRGRWQELTHEATLVTLALEDQGNIETLCPNGYGYAIGDTFWDRTNKLPLVGPMSSLDWQALKAWVVTGPRYQFRLRNNKLLVTPAPTVGYDWRFEYVGRYAITDTTGATFKDRFTVDSDLIQLPRAIVNADLTWRWKKEKGISYAEDFATAERMIVDAVGRSGGQKATLYLDPPSNDAQPGISVPLFTNITRP